MQEAKPDMPNVQQPVLIPLSSVTRTNIFANI
jgi:hypothetical protein